MDAQHEAGGVGGLWFTEVNPAGFSLGLKSTQLLFSERSAFQHIEVVDTVGFGRLMTLDGLVMVTDRDEFVYHEMIAHISLNTHPCPRRVLVIGGGDGGTIREVLRHPQVERAVLCEIDGQVIEVARRYFPRLSAGLADPRCQIHVGDGVQYIRDAAASSFDVVIVDSTDPIGPGVGLFSEAFYGEVRRVVGAEGLVIAQCESPWESHFDLRQVYRNLQVPFGKVYACVGSVPTYPYGCWSWGIASSALNPIRDVDLARAEAIEKGCQYYSAEIHRAAFALPMFMRRKLAGLVANA